LLRAIGLFLARHGLPAYFFCEHDKIMIVFDEAKRQTNLASMVWIWRMQAWCTTRRTRSRSARRVRVNTG